MGLRTDIAPPVVSGGGEWEETRLVETAALVRDGGTFLIPRFRCAGCGGSLSFDDVPERYLAFLHQG